jgi:hypothetical protein
MAKDTVAMAPVGEHTLQVPAQPQKDVMLLVAMAPVGEHTLQE